MSNSFTVNDDAGFYPNVIQGQKLYRTFLLEYDEVLINREKRTEDQSLK
jgi:hypothetical protein